MSTADAVIRARDLSKWYGEVLGVNRVTLDVPPGITSLVGPNGSGKTTLLNLIAGLIRPSKGHVHVDGIAASDPERLNRILGVCTQHDSFQVGFTGEDFLDRLLAIHGEPAHRRRERVGAALARVGLADAAKKKVGAYSKGMRQRLKLALATAHEPRVLLLDEPLNGLDPLARSEVIGLLREMADGGATVLISSHVLHEVDLLSDGVIMVHGGRVVAEGGIAEVRGEISDRPMQVRVECEEPARLASRAFAEACVRSANVDGEGLLVETFDAVSFARLVARMAGDGELGVQRMELTDENVQAVYDYLIRPQVGP